MAEFFQLREVDKGQLIGYGGTYKLPKKSRIATIGVGYADGYQRALSGSSTVFHRLSVTCSWTDFNGFHNGGYF